MAKKFKWTPTKVIITILIVAFFLFILFQTGVFDKITEQFFTTSIDPLSNAVPGIGNGGGGTK